MRMLLSVVVLTTLLSGLSCSSREEAPQVPAEPAAPPPKTTFAVEHENNVAYAQVNGRDLLLHITRPSPLPDKSMPVVMWLHGGGWWMGPARPNANNILAEQGFFTVSLDYRLTGEAKFPAQIHDVKAAIRWLRANAETLRVNPDRIGVWGHSAGGQLAVLAGTSGDDPEVEGTIGPAGHSSRVQAVVNLAGVIDFYHPTEKAWQEEERVRLFGGPQKEHMDLVRLAHPTTFLDKNDPPVLTIHGTADPNVPLHHSTFLHKELTKVGVASTLERLPGKDHWLIQYPAGTVLPEVEASVLSFFKQHLMQ